MPIEELAKALRDVLEREVIPLTQLPRLLESYGYLEGEDGRRNRCRAIAAMIRQILGDERVTELLDLTLKVHALRSVQGLFDITTGPMLTEDYWNELDAKLRELDQKVTQLRQKENKKLILLAFLTDKLNELKCDESFVLPKLPTDLFPAPRYPN